MALGKNIRKHRDKQGLTLEKLSELSGVDVGTISALENRDSSRSKYASAIARGLRMTVEDLERDVNEDLATQLPTSSEPTLSIPQNDPAEIVAEPTIADLLARFRGEMADLPEPLRKAVADLVSDYLKTPDAETGQAVAAAIERLIDRRPP